MVYIWSIIKSNIKEQVYLKDALNDWEKPVGICLAAILNDTFMVAVFRSCDVIHSKPEKNEDGEQKRRWNDLNNAFGNL